ncbi:hypothetical protein TcCL_ESM10208 [Trypanosoma cruzi]|uniref:Uncharacterized protein n=1 Tax=Trypanosoma cruzi (strain CL Brener) TaxID=353153 RepID=Q4D3Q9_TRYCC|nr:hypothetical protein Tc00.1047053510205.30 [Trypanosoma cruzi]EAN87158.1 hypothetical protein Tc00.1047053510205.30 [Trypanosoma cruzi]RNC52547.1 hypothetical protein TcCL_ESM10208 [Trypanosoma cruzi]|eukprot:XP_809009.1 hypothetical protein [Trypanosoma cruzi strain CL Brener]
MSLVDTLMRVGARQFLPMTVHVCDAPSDPKGTSLTTAGIDFALWARIALSEKQEYVRLAAKHLPEQHQKHHHKQKHQQRCRQRGDVDQRTHALRKRKYFMA